jgi:hypothetical protein
MGTVRTKREVRKICFWGFALKFQRVLDKYANNVIMSKSSQKASICESKEIVQSHTVVDL